MYNRISPPPTIRIYDKSFPEHASSVPGKAPERFNWSREDGDHKISVYTHDEIYLHANDMVPTGHTRIAWLFESLDVCYPYFNNIFGVIEKYDFVFTYYKPFTEFAPNIRYVPAMGTWIGGKGDLASGGGDIKAYPKSKLCSMVASDKAFTPLQKYRCHIANIARQQGVDVFGGANRIVHKVDGLADYMFSIAFENGRQPGYFTEKLLDCFATGTIPVYHGDPYIEEMWDIRGIVRMDDVLSGKVVLSPELYNDMLPFALKNMDRMVAEQFTLSEDYMWTHYLETLYFDEPN